MINRIVWVVLDSVGIGELPDAEKFGDVGSNTLGNTAKANGGLNIPNLVKLGIGNIDGVVNIDKCENPIGCFGRMGEISNGKDTTIGHWEMIGVYSKDPFPTYPDGFPEHLMNQFIQVCKIDGILGNYPASGTEIIEQLGEEHLKTKKPIVYTSADSVFQIACHEDLYSPKELYHLCEVARTLFVDEHAVARVIARPFTGIHGNFVRTSNRRDFSLEPPKNNLLVKLQEKNLDVIGIGKIEDIFAKSGITKAIHTKDNHHGMVETLKQIKSPSKGLIFTNLL